MHRSRAHAFRYRYAKRWASIAALVVLPLLLVACPSVGIAADGTEAFRVPFGTLEVSQHEVEPFRVLVPWPGSAPPALAALRIERDGVVLVERVAGVRPSARAANCSSRPWARACACAAATA